MATAPFPLACLVASFPRAAVASRQGDASRIPFSRFLSPAGGEDQGEGGTLRASGVEGRGGRTQRLEVAPAAPLTLPSPPAGRGKEERAPGAAMTEVGRPASAVTPARGHCMAAGMETAFAVALPSRWPACAAPNLSGCGHAQAGPPGRSGELPGGEHRARGVPKSFACARPLHGGRDARRASPFPDSSPPAGERIKERGDAPRKRSRRERKDAAPVGIT